VLPDIFDYLDYRQYFIDVADALRARNPSFSYRAFARMAGHSSPNYLQLIRDRKLGVRDEAVPRLISALGLRKREADYLQALIAFDHAATHEDKDKAFRTILTTREYKAIRTLTKQQYDYFAHWYMPVVRELVVHPDYPDDPAWIAKRIIPSISEAKARKAVTLLDKLGLIHRSADGAGWEQTDRVVSTPARVLSLAVTRYHFDMIRLGGEAIERYTSTDRDIRSVTLGLTPKGYREVKARMQAFWKELLAYAETQHAPDGVYQINMQLFPMSKRERRRRR
jgi:uncharacterized protein (TIGR02147 family)